MEAWNLILKHKKHQLRPDIFIKQHHDILCGWHLDNLTGQPQRKITVIILISNTGSIEKKIKTITRKVVKASQNISQITYYVILSKPTNCWIQSTKFTIYIAKWEIINTCWFISSFRDIKETSGTFTDNPTNGSIETNGSYKGIYKEDFLHNNYYV